MLGKKNFPDGEQGDNHESEFPGVINEAYESLKQLMLDHGYVILRQDNISMECFNHEKSIALTQIKGEFGIEAMLYITTDEGFVTYDLVEKYYSTDLFVDANEKFSMYDYLMSEHTYEFEFSEGIAYCDDPEVLKKEMLSLEQEVTALGLSDYTEISIMY